MSRAVATRCRRPHVFGTTLLAIAGVHATNFTLDDASTSAALQFYPPLFTETQWSQWSIGHTCAGCPDPSDAFNGTYSSGLYYPSQEDMTNELVSIVFTGTTIEYYDILTEGGASSGSVLLDGLPHGTWTASGSITSTYEYNVPLVGISGLANEVHLFQLSYIGSGSTDGGISFDRAVWTTDGTPKGTTPPSQTNYTIDDAGTAEGAIVQYVPSTDNLWNLETGSSVSRCSNCPSASSALNGTYHVGLGNTTSPVQLSIVFTGSAIQIFTILTSESTNVSIVLDGESAGMWTSPAPSGGSAEYNATLFSKNNLSYGQHVLQLSSNGTMIFDSAQFIANGAATTTTSNTAPTSGPSSTGTGPSQSGAANTGVHTSNHHRSVGAIVGGVIGGLAAIFLILAAFSIWRCRAQRRRSEVDIIVPMEEPKELDILPNASTGSPLSLPQLAALDGANLMAQPSPTPASRTLFTSDVSSFANSDPEGAAIAVSGGRGSVSHDRQALLRSRMSEKLRAMEDLQQRVAAGPYSDGPSTTFPTPIAMTNMDDSLSPLSPSMDSGGQQHVVVALNAEIGALRREVENLQTQLHSAWAMGLTDEPPPEYEEEEGESE